MRAHIWRRDQYDRVVATVYGRRWAGLRRADVGLEMIHLGLATAYEAKSGAEFGGPAMEKKYLAAEAEAKRKGLGLWADAQGGKSGVGGGGGGLGAWFGLGKKAASKEPFETPREFKERMRGLEKAEKGETK